MKMRNAKFLQRTARVAALAAVCLAAAFCAEPKNDVLGNPLKIEPLEVNYGVVSEGESVKAEFTVTNVGSSGIMLVSLVASCPCTTAEPEKNYLGPGESTVVRVVYGTRGYIGEKSQYITVTSDAPGGAFIFRLTGTVRPWLYVTPALHRIPFDEGGVKVELKSKLENLGDKPVTVRNVASSGKNIRYKFEPAKSPPMALSPGQNIDLLITAQASEPGAPINGWLDVETVEDAMKHHQITIRQDEKPPEP